MSGVRDSGVNWCVRRLDLGTGKSHTRAELARAMSEAGKRVTASPITAQKPDGPRDIWISRTLLVLALALAVRLVSLWFNSTELFFDEAQYWVWGKEPAFGYFSKPPLLGWLIGGVTAICGDSEFCIRLPSPLIHTATAFVIFLIGKRLFGSRTGFWSALIYATLPAVTLSSTLISTDVALLFFWALALYAFIRFEKENRIRWSVLLGLALGAGLMAKYAMIYFLLCILVYIWFSRERPDILRRKKFWMALGIAFLCVLPNIWWNFQNSFVTASHTGENIGWGSGFPHLREFGEFFLSQFAVFGPILFGLFLAAIIRLPREGMSRRQLLLLSFSVPVLATICIQALMSKAYANWAAVTYIGATVLVADLMVNVIPDWWRRLSMPIHIGVFVVIAVAVAFARPGQLPLPEDRNPFDRMYGAREIADAANQNMGVDRYEAILTDDRRLSALMAYYLRNTDIPKMAWRSGEAVSDHFELTRPYQADPESPVLFMTRFRNPVEIVQSFDEAELLAEFEPPAGEIRRVWFYRLTGYKGTDPGR